MAGWGASLRQMLRGRGARPAPARSDVVFPPGFLESLHRLKVLALRAAGGGLKEGHRLGAYRGGQLEFHDYRAYAEGDDLRYLDWNLYARLERPFVKEFAREEAGAIHLLLDATPSMDLGAPAKWTFVRRVAALFAHVGWSARDRVQAYIFRGAGAPLSTFPSRGVRPGTLAFLEWLRRESTGRARPHSADRWTGALEEAVREFLRRGPARGRVFLASDFWYEEAALSAAVQSLSARGHELAALHVLAREELRPPYRGPLRVCAAEEEGEVALHATDSALARYEAELEEHRTVLAGLLRRRGGLYLCECSDAPIESVLLQTLRRGRWLG